MFSHLICKVRKQYVQIKVERRNEYGFPYIATCCKRCGK